MFSDRQENRLGFYETEGQALLGWKDDYLTTAQFKLNTIGQITLEPKIHKVDKKFLELLSNKFGNLSDDEFSQDNKSKIIIKNLNWII